RFPATTPAETHPLQAFWGMPRRIRLDFADNGEGLPCDLTGGVDPESLPDGGNGPTGSNTSGGSIRCPPPIETTKPVRGCRCILSRGGSAIVTGWPSRFPIKRERIAWHALSQTGRRGRQTYPIRTPARGCSPPAMTWTT